MFVFYWSGTTLNLTPQRNFVDEIVEIKRKIKRGKEGKKKRKKMRWSKFPTKRILTTIP